MSTTITFVNVVKPELFKLKVTGGTVSKSSSPVANIMGTQANVPVLPIEPEHKIVKNLDSSSSSEDYSECTSSIETEINTIKSVNESEENSTCINEKQLEEKHVNDSECDNPSTTEIPNMIKNVNDCTGTLDHSKFLDTRKVVELLLRSESSYDFIPFGLKENVFFIINNKQNLEKRSKNRKSSFLDDCGVWDTSAGSSPKSYYLLQDSSHMRVMFFKNGKYCLKRQAHNISDYVPIDPQPKKNEVVIIHRYYTHLKKDNKYKKRVTWLGDGGLESKFSVVEYVGKFPGLTPHGNSRHATEYIRTSDKGLDNMTQLTGKMKPHQILNRVPAKCDVLSHSKGIQQICDKLKYQKLKVTQAPVRVSRNSADKVNYLENLVNENKHFVRAVIRDSGHAPCTILYLDEQIIDIKNLCCTGKTVLEIDKTFVVSNMHVTITCYQQLTLANISTAESPTFLGPIFIHDGRDFENYCNFLCHLKVKLIDEPIKNLFIESDDEKALVKGITSVFPEANLILCTRRLQEYERCMLTDGPGTVTDQSGMLNKKYGADGPVDDSICFDNEGDNCDNMSEKFLDFFQKRLKTNIKLKETNAIRFDEIDDMWSNTNYESVNQLLKGTNGWKPKMLTEFVQLTYDIVTGQFRDLKSAFLCIGEFRLADSHRQFQCSKKEWLKMTDQQRADFFRRFRCSSELDAHNITSTDNETIVAAQKTLRRKPDKRKRKITKQTNTINAKKCKVI